MIITCDCNTVLYNVPVDKPGLNDKGVLVRRPGIYIRINNDKTPGAGSTMHSEDYKLTCPNCGREGVLVESYVSMRDDISPLDVVGNTGLSN